MPEKVRFHTMANCFSIFLGSAQIEQLLAGGAYLVTPGWLGHWQGWMAQWRFDEKTAGEYFAEFSSRIVLLDTGVDKNVKEKLESFAAFVNIPHETIQVGLDLFRMHLEKAVGDWEIHFDRQEFLRERQELRRQNADYTMAMDLTGRLNLANNETEVIDAVIEIFQMLFAPRRILYFPSRDGKPNKPRLYPAKEAIKEIDSSLIPWAAGEKPDDMLIHIQSGAESFADLYLEGIAYPQFKPHYRNVAFFLSNPVALSIQNARIKQQNNEAKSQMLIRILESYYGALSLHDLSEKLLLLLMKPEYIRGCAILLSGVNGFESVASQGFLEGFLSHLKPMKRIALSATKINRFCWRRELIWARK